MWGFLVIHLRSAPNNAALPCYLCHIYVNMGTQIAQTVGSISIRHRSDTKVSDRFLIHIDQRAFGFWVTMRTMHGWSRQSQTSHMGNMTSMRYWVVIPLDIMQKLLWKISKNMCVALIIYILTHERCVHTDYAYGVVCVDTLLTLQWRHNGRDSVSNHQPHDCLLSGLFGRRSLAFVRGIHRWLVNSHTDGQ